MRPTVPYTKDLVFVGGGHAHALVLRAWGMDPLPGARLTVINPGPTAPYTGMLPGHVAGHYSRDDLEIDLVRLCRHAGARLILDKAVNIDRKQRQVVLESTRRVAYDVASIDVGITAEMEIPGFAEHAIGAKPLDTYAAKWREFLTEASAGKIDPTIAVIGGGVAGCELAMAMAHALKSVGMHPSVTVIERGPGITGMGEAAKEQVKAALLTLGVDVRTSANITRIEQDHVLIDDQISVPAKLTVGAAGAFPHAWIAETDLPLQDGFIEIQRDLGVVADSTLFAVGDCAVMPADPRPKAGVFAVRAAPILHQNLRAALGAGWRRTWRPQKDYLKLVSLGEKSALAEKFGLTLSGPLLWQWKDRIDRAFMKRLSDLPAMAPLKPKLAAAGVAEALAGKPLCGGCGAKVGSGVLRDVMRSMPTPLGDLLQGAGDDAAVIRQAGGGFQVISTDHLRSFVEDPVQMTEIAAVHALGDVWAMGAKPQFALASLILPQMSPELQARTVHEITETVTRVLNEVGAQLIGGHTTMGAELTIGFTVTGTRETAPLSVGGALEGDVLLLTRPIGSGVLLAADMQGVAKGADVANVLAVMAQPQDREAVVLGAVAHAMTDVTGFGLAGHVRSMALASGLNAELRMADVPIYQGAREVSDAGVASTLMPTNRTDAAVEGVEDPLLFDPQTAGGLLAAVPPGKAQKTLDDLQALGTEAVVIGTFEHGSGSVRVK